MSRLEKDGELLSVGIRFLFISLILLGGIYPLCVTFIGDRFFKDLSHGSLILSRDGKTKGSYLMAQKFDSEKYFLIRPSVMEFQSVPSSASQLAPSSLALRQSISERKIILNRRNIDSETCKELLYTSGSGLDPHITTQCARAQIDFIAKHRGVPPEKISKLIQDHEEKSWFGILGRNRVNIVKLNFLLDGLDSQTL
ncbi:potassium-transporting ATPase subunit C [Leptospira idonii]|uniref:Potassium-transporting ATPase subunit C n=1 Tax=Leptospira idonii TaxID=1193500 RepID=A0A4R9M035_9LEPT|nr:potassium-transporting ATPase subunit C [Leptospira idonii]TGN19382.1 potassium-transporting ATPase subunit C [Leptospira idonii]